VIMEKLDSCGMWGKGEKYWTLRTQAVLKSTAEQGSSFDFRLTSVQLYISTSLWQKKKNNLKEVVCLQKRKI
jgi:hypothetical protein